jgi:uncharacterized protein involved in type VI secretion and phage assembly
MSSIEEMLGDVSESIEDIQQKFYGVTVGKVINVVDPMTLGRVQVQLPSIDAVDLTPWARIAVPMAGPGHGFYFIPNIGDEVLVAFEHGDINAPYIVGSLWNAAAPPPLPSPIPQIRMLSTLVGNKIMISEVPPSITISTSTGQQVVMSPAGIQITDGTNVINMTPDGVTITAGTNLNLVAGGQINMTASSITVAASANADISAGGAASVTAPLVRIN